jgi:hypothetical protein
MTKADACISRSAPIRAEDSNAYRVRARRAIAEDEAFLAAHPVRRAKRRDGRAGRVLEVDED